MSEEYKIIEPNYEKFNKQGLQELHNYFTQLLDQANKRNQDVADEMNKTTDRDEDWRLAGRQDMIVDEILWYKTQIQKLSNLLN